MKTIGEIKKSFQQHGKRTGMLSVRCMKQIFGAACRNWYSNIEKTGCAGKEKLRMEQMMQFEHKYEHLGYLCGIDEVGRGPLAGPVVACAVILPKDHSILYLNDSKKLTAHKERNCMM